MATSPGHNIIVVGASAGGVEALVTLARGLPEDLPAAVFIVLHIPAQTPSLLPQILTRAGPLPAIQPADGQRIETGRIYVAPPDHHLIIRNGHMHVRRGPKENRHRPAIDPLFRSAAHAYGPRVVGVVLTGALDDGTAGLFSIKERGGVAVVQDPRDAFYPSMPMHALQSVRVDYIKPMSEIPALLAGLVETPAPEEGEFPVPDKMDIEIEIAESEQPIRTEVDRLGVASDFTCPECHGTLWEIREGDVLRFRCRVGHAYTSESLVSEHSDSLEAALWAALRALEESAALSRRLAERANKHDHNTVAMRFEDKARETDQHAAVVRQILRNTARQQEDVEGDGGAEATG